MDTEINKQLEELLKSRYHGAANIAGIRYQIAYSLLRAFDLYQLEDNARVRLEGIEDVDISGSKEVEARGFYVGSQYVQVKTSRHDWDWGRFAESKIISNFLPVWSADASAELLVVTNFGYAGKLAELVALCQGEKTVPSSKLKTGLRTLCERAGYPNVNLTELLKRISFEQILEGELQTRTLAAIVRCFDLQTSNSDLYLLVLMTKFLDLAVERSEIDRSDLEGIRLFIQENIESGVENPAVRNGWIERVRFEPDLQAEDYYEGSNARPGHILAGLDVGRPPWLDRIHAALHRAGTCVLRTASGQGKSTLLYRYAREHYQPETTFIVKHLSDESMVGSIKQTILARRALGLPILVLLDNVRSDLRFWHRLAAELAGQGVHLLVTMREEDWYRYSSEISAFQWEIVTPLLSLSEARQIFKQFKQKNRVAAGVSSAEWAFEQVSERKLLIEFTYLVTHGQMLSDRLSDQVLEMERLNEDPAKVHILRLVSVAQMYDAKLPITAILRHVKFEKDADSTVASLHREYILCADGRCEGLHFVRSQHLAALLHRIVPLEQTIAELISILDAENLEAFVSAVFVDPLVDNASLLQALVERGKQEPLDVVTRIAKALFVASETLYCRQHQAQFDRAIEEIGSATTTLLCSATLPFQTVDILGDLQKTLPDNSNMKLLSGLSNQFAPRQWQNRSEVRFLQSMIDHVSLEYLQSNFPRFGDFLYWCRLPTLDSSKLSQFLAGNDWKEFAHHADLPGTADFLYELRLYAPENYQSLVESNKKSLISRFKLLSDTLSVEERGENLSIEFMVEEGGTAGRRPNEQAWERLRTLYKMFPTHSLYCSKGLYARIYGRELPIDDAHKEPAAETFQKEMEAKRNSIYFQAVDAQYATKFVYQWQQQWFTIRRDLASLVTRLLNFFENRRGSLDEMNKAWRDLTIRLQQVTPLPESFKDSLAEEQKKVNSWAASLSNFLRQLSQADKESQRLMRHNLRDAAKHLPQAQQAFERVIAYTQEYFDLTSLNRGEAEQYEYLADVLDVRLENPELPVSRRSILEGRENRRKEFVNAIQAALTPLQDEGFVFTFPRDRLVDFPLISICLGFDVIDFERLVEQMAVIISHLAALPLEYHFLYLVPLLDGARYSGMWQISSDSIAKLAKGVSPDNGWGFSPAEVPDKFLSVLPDCENRILPELSLVGQFYVLYAEINAVRNTAYLVSSRLRDEQEGDVQLGALYKERLQSRMDEVLRAFLALNTEMLKFEGVHGESKNSIQRSVWLEFCDCSKKKFEFLRNSVNVDSSFFEPVNVLNDIELETLFARYLNAKYRGSLTEITVGTIAS